MERILRSNHAAWLPVVEARFASCVEVYHPVGSVFQDVYGRQSGEEGFRVHDTVQAVVVGDDFFTSDSTMAGAFTEGILYTSSDKILVGDLVRLAREDCKQRRYKVVHMEEIGSTQGVFRKYKISAVGD
jgi:hypothetical protein